MMIYCWYDHLWWLDVQYILSLTKHSLTTALVFKVIFLVGGQIPGIFLISHRQNCAMQTQTGPGAPSSSHMFGWGVGGGHNPTSTVSIHILKGFLPSPWDDCRWRLSIILDKTWLWTTQLTSETFAGMSSEITSVRTQHTTFLKSESCWIKDMSVNCESRFPNQLAFNRQNKVTDAGVTLSTQHLDRSSFHSAFRDRVLKRVC